MAPKDNRNSKAANTLLNNRLMAYSVIAGAVLGNTAAKAAVQKTTPNVTLDANGETFNVVFGGQTRFSIELVKYTTSFSTTSAVIQRNYLGLVPRSLSAGFIYSGAYAKALSAGVTIGSSAGFKHAGSFRNMGYFYNLDNWYTKGSGQFPNTTGKFIGLQFQISGTTYYGWVQVDVNSNVTQAIIQSQAWEDTPGLSIITGSDVSLPVQATQVIAESTLRGVILQWGTESELDHLGFVIERRLAGTDGEWELVSSYETNTQLKGQGNKSTHTSYQFVDSDVESGMEYEYKVYAVDINGTISSEQIIRVQHTSSLPTELALLQNYPNPFNPSTNIQFDLPEDTHVKLSVYNVSGQVVDILVDRPMAAGTHIENLDASNYSVGIYFYELIAGDKRMVRKMHLLK